MRIVLAFGILLSLLNILMADTELQFSSAKEVMFFVILSESVKQLNYFFRAKIHITILKSSTLVVMMSSLKGEKGLF